MSATRRPYAITTAAGEIEYIGLHTSEDECWRIVLGWPSAEEVMAAKAEGLSCCTVIVTREPVEPHGEYTCTRCGIRQDEPSDGAIPF